MKKLLKEYGLNSDMQYFEMIAESFLNGQISQAKEQFKAMPKANRVKMLHETAVNWNSGIDSAHISLLFQLI